MLYILSRTRVWYSRMRYIYIQTVPRVLHFSAFHLESYVHSTPQQSRREGEPAKLNSPNSPFVTGSQPTQMEYGSGSIQLLPMCGAFLLHYTMHRHSLELHVELLAHYCISGTTFSG